MQSRLFIVGNPSMPLLGFISTKYTFKSDKKRQYHREGRMSKAEVMMIMILFHSSGYRCLKHFYLDRVCKHMRHLFPDVELTLRYICAVHRKDSVFYIHSLYNAQ